MRTIRELGVYLIRIEYLITSLLRSDHRENMTDEGVILFRDDGSYEEKAKSRQDLQSGDILLLRGHRSVPADVLILHTSLYKDSNQCYVETANIDGESNLKLREAPPEIRPLIDGGCPSRSVFEGHLRVEPPNKSVYTFHGTFHLEGKENPITLGPNNLLLRGSTLSNTDWALGVVVYTGEETKIQMNSRRVPSKMSKIERYANNAIKIIFAVQVDLFYGSYKTDYI